MRPIDYIGIPLTCPLTVALMDLVTGLEPSLFVYVGSPIVGLIFYKGWKGRRGSV